MSFASTGTPHLAADYIQMVQKFVPVGVTIKIKRRIHVVNKNTVLQQEAFLAECVVGWLVGGLI